MKALAILLLCSTAALAEQRYATEEDRRTPQPIEATPDFKFPQAAREALANGMRLSLIPLARPSLVAVKIVFPSAGAALDPAGKEGLAGFVAAMMLEGTAAYPTKAEFADAKGDIGAGIGLSAGADYLSLSIVAEPAKLDAALGLAAELARRPTFASKRPESAAALERLRAQALEGIRQERAEPGGQAGKRLALRLFGGSPQARPTTEASVRAITLDDVADAHRLSLCPDGAIVTAVGDFDPATLRGLVEKHFGDWQAPAGAPAVAGKAVTEPDPAIDLIDMPNRQATLRIGFRTGPRSNPDSDKLMVASAVLGERLNDAIRKQRGWTYGAESVSTSGLYDGTWMIATDVTIDKAAESIAVIVAEIKRLAEEGVSERELADQKTSLKGGILNSSIERHDLADWLARIEVYGQPVDNMVRVNARIDGVSAADVREMAKKYLRPEAMHIVVAGPAAVLQKPLAARGPVRVLDVYGNVETVPAGAAK